MINGDLKTRFEKLSTTPNMVYRPRPQQLTTWKETSNYPMSHHPQSGARYQLTACKLWLGKVKKVKCPLTHTCILNCVQRDNEWKCWDFLKIEQESIMIIFEKEAVSIVVLSISLKLLQFLGKGSIFARKHNILGGDGKGLYFPSLIWQIASQFQYGIAVWGRGGGKERGRR